MTSINNLKTDTRAGALYFILVKAMECEAMCAVGHNSNTFWFLQRIYLIFVKLVNNSHENTRKSQPQQRF